MIRFVSVSGIGHKRAFRSSDCVYRLTARLSQIHIIRVMIDIAWETAGEFTDIKYEKAEGDRKDHHKPSRGSQRLPAADGRGDAAGPRRCPRRPRGRDHHPDRRGAGRFLLRRRPEGARRRRIPRRPGRPATHARWRVGWTLPRHGPARPDPTLPQARGGDGRRICRRRGTRATRDLRPGPSPQTTRSSDRSARRSAASMAASVPRCLPSSSGRKRPRKYGFSAACTPPRRRYRWAW